MPDLPDDLMDLTRDELDELARDRGIPDPEGLPNKEAVVEAIEAPNPALVPEPEPEPEVEAAAPVPDPEPEPGEHAYEVVGPHEVFGHKPGAKFTAAIPAEQESFLIEVGHIKRLNQEH